MPRYKNTWDDAAARWLRETQHKKSHRDDRAKIKWLDQHLKGRSLEDITRDQLAHLGAIKAQESSPATANRYLALLRAIFRRAAVEWEWIERPPFVRLYPEQKRRVRWLTPEQASMLLEELPQHHVQPFIFALSTGLRQSNVCTLKWEQIDLKRRTAWIFGDNTKNGEDLHISLNDAAMSVLYARRWIHREYVFTYQGKPIARLSTRAWYKALKRAGIEDFRWHDLRHTWASWLVQGGVPLFALQEMGGWKTASMVRKYAHLSPAHNLQHAQVIDQNLRIVSQRSNKD